MGKGKMIAISMLITACFVSLAAVLMFFISDEGFEKVKQTKGQNELQNAVSQHQEQPEEDEKDGYLQQGFELIETEEAIYDVMFDNATSVKMDNGPINLNVKNVKLEVIQPISENMKKKLEGTDKVTVIRLQVEATNISNEIVNFDLSSLTVGSDIGEKSRIDQLLSDKLSTMYKPGEKKEGELVILFKSKPDLIASVWLNVRSPFNETGEELGVNEKLKINLFK